MMFRAIKRAIVRLIVAEIVAIFVRDDYERKRIKRALGLSGL